MIEISPGYGASGISEARHALMLRIANAVRSKLRNFVVGFDENQVSIRHDRGAPQVVVQFDQHTALQLDGWPMGTSYGYRPSWFYRTSLGGSMVEGGLALPRVGNWTEAAADAILAMREVLLTVSTVETP